MASNRISEDQDFEGKVIVSCFSEKIDLNIFDPLFQELINSNRYKI